MTKDILTEENARNDLNAVLRTDFYDELSRRISLMIPFIALALILWLPLKLSYLALIPLPVVLYHLVQCVIEIIRYRGKKRALFQNALTVFDEVFSHIANETVYKPYLSGLRIRFFQTVRLFYFQSGACFRIPSLMKHYKWSRDFAVSTKGLEQISLSGDTFYLVSLQGYPELIYIYPCKRFTLDKCFATDDKAPA